MKILFNNAEVLSITNGIITIKIKDHLIKFHNSAVSTINDSTIILEFNAKQGDLIKISKNNKPNFYILDCIFNNDLFSFGKYPSLEFNLPHKINILDCDYISLASKEEIDTFKTFCKTQEVDWNNQTYRWVKTWKPKLFNPYYIITSCLKIEKKYYTNNSLDKEYINCGNYFKTKIQAKRHIDRILDLTVK